MFPECVRHGTEVGHVTEFRIELPMVDDVVTMRTARSCFQVRRGVDVTDPKPPEVGRQCRGGGEPESLMKLQTIGRPWDRWRQAHRNPPPRVSLNIFATALKIGLSASNS